MMHQSKIEPGFVYLGNIKGNYLQEVYANPHSKRWCMIEARQGAGRAFYYYWRGPKEKPGVTFEFWNNAAKILQKFFEGDISISPNSK